MNTEKSIRKFIAEKKETANNPESQARLIKSIKVRKIKRVTEKLLRDLCDLRPFIYHVSGWNSVYIKFDNYPWSLRLGDHSVREKYNYKINIHTEKCEKDYWLEADTFSNKRNHHFSLNSLQDAIDFALSREA